MAQPDKFDVWTTHLELIGSTTSHNPIFLGFNILIELNWPILLDQVNRDNTLW